MINSGNKKIDERIPWVGERAGIYSSCSGVSIECFGEYGKYKRCEDCIFRRDCQKEKNGKRRT